MTEPTRLLFVCTGNICRSPTAEGVALAMARRRGLADRVIIDSAGTENYHVGDPPDSRTIAHALRRGYDLRPLRARQLAPTDYHRFDFLLAMDHGHRRIMEGLRPASASGRIELFTWASERYRDAAIPDPYYGGEAGFEHVLDMVEESVERLLDALFTASAAPRAASSST